MTIFERNKIILQQTCNPLKNEARDICFKVLKPRHRGKGLIINKEFISGETRELEKIHDNIRHQCKSETKKKFGYVGRKFKDKYGPIKESWLKLKDDFYAKNRDDYFFVPDEEDDRFDKTVDDCIEERKSPFKPRALVLAVGEELKFKESKSWAPATVMFGTHTKFLDREEKHKAFIIASAIDMSRRGGKFKPRDDDPGFMGKMYGLTPEKIKKHNMEVKEYFKGEFHS